MTPIKKFHSRACLKFTCPEDVKIGNDAKATIDSTETSIIFNIRIFLLIISAILFFILNKAITSKAWAIISNIIKPKITNLLNNLYKS